MRILITGGSGFIGTNAVEHFSKDFDVMNVDIAKPKMNSHIKYWTNIDICEYNSLEHAVMEVNPDDILHLAARTDLDGKSVSDYSANTIGVENVLKVASKLKHLKKIVITSSMLVCHVAYQPKDQYDYSPSTFYGESKVITEQQTWKANLKCDWAIIRPTSIWGPWFGEPYRNFFDIVKKRMYFHLGNKGCTKTYGYVGNSIYQIDRLLLTETSGYNQKVFYIGDKPAINISEWADEIGKELGFKIPTMPWGIVKLAAYLGDGLKRFGFHFPMTSFRLKNMTTDNIINLDLTYEVAPNPPYNKIKGVRDTLKWLELHK